MRYCGHEKIFVTTTFRLCDNNGYTTTQIRKFFASNGFDVVSAAETADWIVISTCGFDQERENVSLAIVSDYLREYSEKKRIIICGCLPKISDERFGGAHVFTIGPKELYKFNDLFSPRTPIEEVSGGHLDERFISKEYGLLDAYYLQICQGCVNSCSYCAIKKAKGYVTSRPLDKLMRELKQAVECGYNRVMLLADDCGSYGADLGIDFADLLRQVRGYNVRVSINYIEPGKCRQLYVQYGLDIFDNIDFINIPIQSTSGRLLQLMDRHYDSADVMRMVRELKARSSRTFFETHIIYGFPSETPEEFEDTFRALESFDSVIYFYYTDRRGAKASLLQPKISDSEMIRRTQRILSHPKFSVGQDGTSLPCVLLGYELQEGREIFKSLARSRLGNKSEFVILGQ
jgi:MiaB/RimO family radical SAM methylthiotransferase